MKILWKGGFSQWPSLLLLLFGVVEATADNSGSQGSRSHLGSLNDNQYNPATKPQVPWYNYPHQHKKDEVQPNSNSQPVRNQQDFGIDIDRKRENKDSKVRHSNSDYLLDPVTESVDSRRQPLDNRLPTHDSSSQAFDSMGQPMNSSSSRRIYESNGRQLISVTDNPVDPLETSTNTLHNAVAEVRDRDLAAVTIAVLGRSGSGVSSTIRELIGPNSKCAESEGAESFINIKEHIIEIPSSSGNINKIRILDIPGFVDGRTFEDESRILASLKSIIQTRGHPDFYLGLSKFDDNRYDGEHSLLVQFLKRVELFQDIFMKNTMRNTTEVGSNIVFLLTRLMSETRANQRRPDRKINDFSRVIQKYANFPSPISIVVGDNKAESEHGADVENGYYKLPNKQLYPKNIWETFINISSNETIKNILTALMDSREVALKCEARLISTEWEHFEGDANAFQFLLTQTNITIENTEINSMIEDIFQQQSEEEKMISIVQKIALQLQLQQENITNRDNLPMNLADRAKFFQKDLIRSAPIPASILQAAFGLQMPEYITPPLTVGYGYVLMEDELSPRTPFKTDISTPSPVGYQLPKFMKCKKLIRPEIQYFKSYSVNMTEYIEERLKYLDFPGKENTNKSSFIVKIKEGFNMQPEEGDNLPTLTVVEERRILTCSLLSDRKELELEPEFIEEVNALNEFDKHKRDSVTEWKNWFSKWGSHIVINGYGGGRLHGSIVGPNVRNVLESQSSIDDTLNSIVEFTPFTAENLGSPAYRLFGGGNDAPSENLHELNENDRKELIEQWEDSLNSQFIMLTNEFRLEPLSNVINDKIGMEKGEIVEKAIELLLSGQLKYERKGRGNKGNRRKNNRNGSNPNNLNNRQEPGTGIQTQQNFDPSGSSTVSPNTHISTGNTSPLISDAGNYSLDFENHNLTEAMQAHIDFHSANILALESQLSDMKEKGNREHKRLEEDLERMRLERSNWKQRKQAELERQRQQIKSTDNYYQTTLHNQEENHELELGLMQRQLEEMKRSREEADKRHQEYMAKVKKEMEEEREREKASCSGWGFFKCAFG